MPSIPIKVAVQYGRDSLVGNLQALAIGATVVDVTISGRVMLQADGADIRFTLDGTAPVAGTNGFVLVSGAPPLLLEFLSWGVLKAIADYGSPKLQIQLLG